MNKQIARKIAECKDAAEGIKPTAAGGGKREAREWQRSKFCEAMSEQRISGTATGRRFESCLKQPQELSEKSGSSFFVSGARDAVC